MARNLAQFIIKRSINAVVTIFFLILIIFILVHAILPSPLELAKVYAGNPHVPPQQLTIIIKQYNLDAPLPVQFLNYVINVFQGNFGIDTLYKIPESILLDRFLPITLELVIPSVILAILLGIFTGAVAASNRNAPIDQAIRGLYLGTWSAPAFLVGFVIQLVLAYQLGLLPPTGLVDPTISAPPSVTGFPVVDAILAGNLPFFASVVHHMVLPVLVLTVVSFGVVTRISRAGMIDALDRDYVKLDLMKGFSKRHIVYKTALRNAAIPIITLAALFFGTATAGAVIVEDIFEYHGMGWFAVQAIYNFDYIAILGVTIIVGISVLIANLIADLLYGVADPRIRMS